MNKSKNIEYEVKVIDIDYKNMIKLLKKNNAKLVHSKTMYYRKIFYPCDKSVNGYVRVRNENDVITITSKIYKNKNETDNKNDNENEKFPEEYEIISNLNFSDTCNFISSL
jgi:adenylate cyclase class IV